MSGIAVQLTSAASARRAVAARIGKAARGGDRREIRPGSVLVTGSSGKGTTCRILAQLMSAAGLHPVLAAEGARLRPGLAAAMVSRAVVTRRMRTDPQATGLLEVEPGSLPQLLRREPPPAILVCTNLFRGQPGGQPDSHVETAAVTALLKHAMRALPASTTLILNADDPRVADLAADLPNPRLYFGISDPLLGRLRADPAAGAARCPRCGGRLSYACAYYAHLGHWACGRCGRRRPEPDVSVTKIDLAGPSSSRLQVFASSTRTVLEVPLPGMYNAYNALAAVTAAMHLGLPDWSLGAIENVSGGPLRMERVRVAGHDVYLAVATNATEYAEVLRAVLGDGEPKRVLLGLSARQRREHDVSWIWDVDFESLAGLVPAAVVSGNRAADLAVRLKYAGWLGDGQDQGQSAGVTIEPDPVRAVRAAIAGTPPGQPLWVVSTATALAEIRRWLRHHDEVLGLAIAHGGHAAASPQARVLAAVRPTGPRPPGPGLSGPQPSGPQPSGPQPSGPQPSGPQPSGPQPAAPPFSGRRPEGRSGRGRSGRRQPGQAGAAR
jgi:lipid II isoglutaminyl synthase (glutamine-hydrolysing)